MSPNKKSGLRGVVSSEAKIFYPPRGGESAHLAESAGVRKKRNKEMTTSLHRNGKKGELDTLGNRLSGG